MEKMVCKGEHVVGQDKALRAVSNAGRWARAGLHDPDFGARPLKRAIQRELQDPLALAILSSEFHEGDLIRVEREGDAFKFISVSQNNS